MFLLSVCGPQASSSMGMIWWGLWIHSEEAFQLGDRYVIYIYRIIFQNHVDADIMQLKYI